MPRSDRPLSRRLAKLAMTLRHGRAGAHAQDWWPGLALDVPGDGRGRATWRGRPLAALHPYLDFAAEMPDAVTIIGSGPSVADSAVEALPDRSALLLNGAVALMADRCPRPLAIFVEDERFVHRHHAMLTTRIGDDTWCALSVSALRALAGYAPRWLAARRLLPILNLVKPYRARRRDAEALARLPIVATDPANGAALSTDPGRGVVPAGTVALTAMQFALAGEPSHVGLAGIELDTAARPRFYETAGNAAPSGLIAGRDRALRHFALARRIAGRRGIDTPCHAPDSALLDVGYRFAPIAAPGLDASPTLPASRHDRRTDRCESSSSSSNSR